MNIIKRSIKCMILGKGLDPIYDRLKSITGLSVINANKKYDMLNDANIVFILAYNVDHIALKGVLLDVKQYVRYVFPIIISKDVEEGNILFINPDILNGVDMFDYIVNAIGSIVESINIKNPVSLDIEDFSLLFNRFNKLLFTYGEAFGNKALIEANNKAISMLSNDLSNINYIIYVVTGGENDISLIELNEAISLLKDRCNINTNIIFGIKLDKHLGDAAKVHIWLG